MTLIDDVLKAQAEGLRPNTERLLNFIGAGPLELQILGGKRRYEENQYAHPRDAEDAVKLFDLAERQEPTGVYVVVNEPDDAVTSRNERGRWHVQKKGEALTDADIVARRVLFVDVDWARTRGTSTTDEHCALSLEGAAKVYERIAQSVSPYALAFGHSGNCGSVLAALDRIPETPALATTIKEILYCLHYAFTDPRIQADRNARNGIDIDTSVSDAKRLAPAFGTTKRKGAGGNAERPHRRTALVCPADPHRLKMPELLDLVRDLRGDLSADQLTAIDRELGRVSKTVARTPSKATRTRYAGPDVFADANRIPKVHDVLSWLGLLDGDQPRCPGCGESDGSSVAIVGNGLKCLHNRCSREGVKPGFRTVVDIVMAVRHCEAIDAARELGERFGFTVPAARERREEDLPPEAFRDDDAHLRDDEAPALDVEITDPPVAPQATEEAPEEKKKPRKKAPTRIARKLQDKGEWIEDLKLDQYGNPKKTYGNLCVVLRNAYGDRLAYDRMRATPTLDTVPLGDADVGRIREELERKYALEQSSGNVIDGVRQIAEERRFHPVEQYLRGVVWDGKVRLPSIATDVLGTTDPLHTRMVMAWFVQAARRALVPGCKADATLVLIGEQGFLKSTFFAILGGSWFADTKMDLTSRDGLMQLAAAWIYEWGEIDRVTSRNHASDVKQFTTSQVDAFRPPFGKAIIQHPRSSVIVGSTNETQFLTDATGSRRFWCVDVPRRLTDESLAFLRQYRDQLWAEAVVNVESNYQAYLTLDEEKRREELAEAHQVSDAFQEAIARWLHSPNGRRIEAAFGYITAPDLLEHALGIDKARWDTSIQTRVGKAMRRLRWQHARRRVEGRLVWVYMRPLEYEATNGAARHPTHEDPPERPPHQGEQTSWEA